MRWLVGDLQGCATEFDRLLTEIRFDPDRDELWCLGDLVNRGPDSLAALRLWRDVGGHAVIGNHDAYALLARSGRKSRKGDTLDALFDADDADALLDRLRRQPILAHLPATNGGQDVWVVHAGLRPGWDDLEATAERLNAGDHDDDWLDHDDVRFAVRVRHCTADGRLCRHMDPSEACPWPCAPWDAFYRGSTLVIHGHWAIRGYYRGERTMGLDSGCVYGGSLTAWCQEEDRIVQIPSALGQC